MLRIPLNTVTPAQRRGAYSAGSASAGMLTTASVRRVQYSASGITCQSLCFHLQLRTVLSQLYVTKTGILTSSVPVHAVHNSCLAHLVQSLPAGFANPIVTTMPWSANLVSDFPFCLAIASRDDGANDFMTWDTRKRGPTCNLSVSLFSGASGDQSKVIARSTSCETRK